MMDENPMEALSVLQERLRTICSEHGLELQAFVAIPGSDGAPHMAQAHFVLDTAKAFATPEQRETDKMIAEMEAAERVAARKEAEDTARESLLRSIAEADNEVRDGIGLDLDDGGIGLG